MRVLHWLDSEWRIVEQGLGCELQTWGYFDWVTRFEAPVVRYCVAAYESYQNGEIPPDWEEMTDD